MVKPVRRKDVCAPSPLRCLHNLRATFDVSEITATIGFCGQIRFWK
jgi:hypothetical protein